ncbi:MAG: rhomboid family intramembrane serine protease [Bacteroidota bacterium]
MSSDRTIVGSSIVPFRIVFLMWLIFVIDTFLSLGLNSYGIVPRTQTGLIGVLTSPLLHGGLLHLVSNTFPLLFLGAVLFFFFNNIARQVFFSCYFMTGLLVWLFARGGANHIGASGLVYGLAFFLIFYGLFRRDVKSLFISLIIIILYNGLFFGILPSSYNTRISWESHLFGGLVGLGNAIIYRRKS